MPRKPIARSEALVLLPLYLFACMGQAGCTGGPDVAHRAPASDSPRDGADVKSSLPAGLEEAFMLPDADKDQHGNPVVARKGSRVDPATGLAHEIWLKTPRMEMVLIPEGEFDMGSPYSEPGRFMYEGPVHRVTFAKPFYIGKYEVTQGQWEAVTGSNPSKFPGAGRSAPVERVSWEDCLGFIKQLGSVLDQVAFRLPSEAEWEYACRAGTTTATYTGPLMTPEPWVDVAPELDEIAWYLGNSCIKFPDDKDSVGRVIRLKEVDPDLQDQRIRVGPHPVGMKKPNAWGLHDMLGNVYEWCEDVWHDHYVGAPSDGSAWFENGDLKCRVQRGGSWESHAGNCRSSTRGIRWHPRDDRVGLRLALSPRTP